jgi:hypothetical protein
VHLDAGLEAFEEQGAGLEVVPKQAGASSAIEDASGLRLAEEVVVRYAELEHGCGAVAGEDGRHVVYAEVLEVGFQRERPLFSDALYMPWEAGYPGGTVLAIVSRAIVQEYCAAFRAQQFHVVC